MPRRATRGRPGFRGKGARFRKDVLHVLFTKPIAFQIGAVRASSAQYSLFFSKKLVTELVGVKEPGTADQDANFAAKGSADNGWVPMVSRPGTGLCTYAMYKVTFNHPYQN
eukprot:2703645-Rhodomonas_salina.2